ncbi:MAG TPA: hypothetical protein DDW70_10105 [Rikenellaceae bacterium]|nr:hypothetical protein [Rikenellaceae bacterium]
MKKIMYWLLSFMILFASCEKKTSYPPAVGQNLKHLKDTINVYPGVARIKVTDQMAELLSKSTSSADQVFAG